MDYSQEPVISDQQLKEILGEGEEAKAVLKELVSMFAEDVPTRLEKIQVALDSQNFSEVHEQVHAMKGSSGNLGAMRMFAMSQKILEGLSEGQTENLREDVELLKKEFELIMSEFGKRL